LKASPYTSFFSPLYATARIVIVRGRIVKGAHFMTGVLQTFRGAPDAFDAPGGAMKSPL
jgi:hypothetical protein